MADKFEINDPILKALVESASKTPKKNYYSEDHAHHDPALSINLETNPKFENLNKLDKFSARLSSTALKLSISAGYIEPQKIKSIFEFGAGSGGSTLALKSVADSAGATLEVAEENTRLAESLKSQKILPDENIFVGDGIVKLKKDAAEGKRYNLVAAFMLGPLMERADLTGKFFGAAADALEEDGKIIITSDAGSIAHVEMLLKRRMLPYQSFAAVMEGDTTMPPTIILTKDAASRLSKPALL